MNIVVLNECFLKEEQIKSLKSENKVKLYEVTNSKEDTRNRIKNAEIIFADQFVCPLDNDTLDFAKNLKCIILNTTSYHLVDLEYLKSKNISLFNTPDFCTGSVAELVFLYILQLMRNVESAYKDNIKKPFEILPDEIEHRKYVGSNLNQKTIGVIGMGNIGQKVLSIAKGFNMNCLGFNRSQKNILDTQQVQLDELLSKSDIIVLTIPYSSNTHHFLNKENMRLLKKNVIIVNISSNDLIEEDYLIEKIKNKEVKGYGLDDFRNKDKKHFFYNSKNVFILPHLGFFTQESLDMIGKRMIESYNSYINNKKINRIL